MITATLIAVLVFFSPAAQDAKPDFSGKWTLDVAKSDFGQMPPPESMVAVIEHKEPNVKITSTQKNQQGEVTNERTMTTDGKENNNTLRTMMGDQPITSTTKWNGKALVTAFRLAFQETTIDVSESWDLAADGKTLTVTRDFKSQQGDFSQKSVFNKQ
ncbi:MAG TPA: hypothetical protein VFJ02_15095 [Vicinamibacterales bacterium]|nr:hypothetical protein [Vicinamibacterales bacterium]